MVLLRSFGRSTPVEPARVPPTLMDLLGSVMSFKVLTPDQPMNTHAGMPLTGAPIQVSSFDLI